MAKIIIRVRDTSEAMEFIQKKAKTGAADWILVYHNPRNKDFKTTQRLIQAFGLFIGIINGRRGKTQKFFADTVLNLLFDVLNLIRSGKK